MDVHFFSIHGVDKGTTALGGTESVAITEDNIFVGARMPSCCI